MRIISHRGINHKDPENSLPAFEWAMKKGYPIELDVYLTKEGIPVISHDNSIDRLFNGQGKIKEITLEEIRQYNYKNHPDVKMPTFEEVCKLYNKIKPKNFFFCIQIKDMHQKDVMKKTCELFKKYSLPEESFFYEVDDNAWLLVEWMKENLREMPVGLHLPETTMHYDEKSFKKADVIWADEIHKDWMSKEMVEMAHKFGKRTYAISAELIPHSKHAKNYKERWKDLIEYGFDGICTDYAEELETFIKNFNKT